MRVAWRWIRRQRLSQNVLMDRSRYAERIVCMTEETTETLYALGEEWRIVGISGFTVRPPRARREKPKVSAFTTAKIGRILDLEPDLVLGFSDIQADIAAELVRAGIAVHVFNHRSVAGIFRMIRMLGGLTGEQAKAADLADRLESKLEQLRLTQAGGERPSIYFEEWGDPQISGIRWVSELVGIAGGDDCFPELAASSLARGRIISDPAEVVRRAPDIIIGSWCGKKFRPDRVRARPGWSHIPAIRCGDVYEVKSALILQPGPAAVTDGVAALARIVNDWRERRSRGPVSRSGA
jgi:iron complex transport system substrate-binding protein